MQELNLINEIVLSFTEAILIVFLFTFLVNQKGFVKSNKFKSVIFIVLYTLFSYWASIYMPSGFHTVCISIFAIVVLSFIVSVNIYASIISFSLISIFIIIIEAAILILEMLLFKANMNMIMNTINLKLFHSILGRTIQIIIAILIYRSKINLFTNKFLDKKNSLSSFIMLQAFIMGTFVFSLNFVVCHQTNTGLYNILLLSIYLLFLILAFLDFQERERLLLIQNKFEVQEEYVNNMESVMDIIRREKHDFANHLNTIFALCLIRNDDSLERIEAYIRKLSHNLKSSYSFYHTGNDYIDGLLAVKSNYAFENDILLEVEIKEPLTKVSVRDSDLTSIIGNIVDNAFESILSESAEGKVVSIYTYIDDGSYYISIVDNGPMIPKEVIGKLFDNGFSTKMNKKKDHGYGLHITQQLTKRNNGEISVSSDEEETEFLIKFNVGELKDGKISRDDYQCNTA